MPMIVRYIALAILIINTILLIQNQIIINNAKKKVINILKERGD